MAKTVNLFEETLSDQATPQSPQVNPYQDPTPTGMQKALINAGQGFDRLNSGVQGLFRGDEYTQRKQDEYEQFNQSEVAQGPLAATARFVGNTAPAMMFPASKAGPIGRGLYNAGLSAIEEFTNMPDKGDTRTGNAKAGAAGGWLGGEMANGISKMIPDWAKNKAASTFGREAGSSGYSSRVEELKRIGIENPTLDEITGDMMDLSEGSRVMSSDTPLAAEYRMRKGQSNKAMGDTLDDMVTGLDGSSDDVYGIGTDITDSVQKGRKSAAKEGGKLYDEIRDNMPSGMVSMDNSIQKILTESEEVSDDAAMRKIVGRINRLMDDVVDPATGEVVSAKTVMEGLNSGSLTPELAANQFEAVRRQAVKLMNGEQDGTVKKGLKKIIESMELDAENAFGRDIYKAARDNYKKTVFDRFDNQKITGDMLKGKVAPEDLINKIMTGSYKADELKELVKTLGPGQQLNNLKAGVMMHLRKKAQQGVQMDEFKNPVIFGGNLKKALAQNGMPQKMEAVLGKEGKDTLYEISEIMHSVTSRPRGSISTSGSGEMMANVVATFKKARMIPVLANFLEPILGGRKDDEIEAMARRLLNPKNSNMKEAVIKPGQRAAREAGSEAGTSLYNAFRPEAQ